MHIYVYVCTYILVDTCSAFSQVMVSAAVIPVQHRATQSWAESHTVLGTCFAGWPQASVLVSKQNNPERFLALVHVVEREVQRQRVGAPSCSGPLR